MKKKKKLRLKRPFQLILAALLFLLAFSFFQLIKNQFKQENPLVSTQVLNYEDLMLKYARENDIEEYIGFKIPEKSLEEIFLDEKLLESEESVLKKKAKKKESKSKNINKEITKLYFNGGKKKKIRAVDFVGTISNIEGVSSDDIGIIEIGDMGSYVEILNGKGKLVLEKLKDSTIKGKKLKVEIAKKR